MDLWLPESKIVPPNPSEIARFGNWQPTNAPPFKNGLTPTQVILATPGAIAWFRFDQLAAPALWTDVIGGFAIAQPVAGLRPVLGAGGFVFDGVDDVFVGAATMMSGARYFTHYMVASVGTAGAKVVAELGGAGANNGFAIFSGVISGGLSSRVLDPAASPDQWGKTAFLNTLGVWNMYGDKADAVHPTNPIELNAAAVAGAYDLTQAGAGTFANSTWTLGGRAVSLPCNLTIMDWLICAGAAPTAENSTPQRAATTAAFRTLRGV
jgi:hypothetical protein